MKNKKILWIATPAVIVLTLAIFWKPILISIALWLGGYKDPQLETKESVTGFIKARSARYDALAIPATGENSEYLNRNFHAPGIIFFNRELLPIQSSSGTGCPKTAAAFISDLQKEKTFEPSYKNIEIKNLNDVLNKVKWIDGDHARLMDRIAKKDFDFVAVYSWIKFLPEQSTAMMEIGKNALKNTNSRVLVLSLNLDYVKDWYGDKPVEKIEFDIK